VGRPLGGERSTGGGKRDPSRKKPNVNERRTRGNGSRERESHGREDDDGHQVGVHVKVKVGTALKRSVEKDGVLRNRRPQKAGV